MYCTAVYTQDVARARRRPGRSREFSGLNRASAGQQQGSRRSANGRRRSNRQDDRSLAAALRRRKFARRASARRSSRVGFAGFSLLRRAGTAASEASAASGASTPFRSFPLPPAASTSLISSDPAECPVNLPPNWESFRSPVRTLSLSCIKQDQGARAALLPFHQEIPRQAPVHGKAFHRPDEASPKRPSPCFVPFFSPPLQVRHPIHRSKTKLPQKSEDGRLRPPANCGKSHRIPDGIAAGIKQTVLPHLTNRLVQNQRKRTADAAVAQG